MVITKQTKYNRIWALVMGVGLALTPIHSLWLTEITSIGGKATLFLPAIGTGMWILGALFFALNNWERLNWGNRYILSALIIIAVSMGVSSIFAGGSIQEMIAPLLMGFAFVFVYVVARTIGKEIFKPFLYTTIIVALSAVVYGLIRPGVATGGLITNYCASAGYIVFGALVIQGKYQWALIAVALMGLFFIGALEAVFIVGIVGIVVLARRDFSKSLVIIAAAATLLIGIWAILGHLASLYEGNNNLYALGRLITGKASFNVETLDAITTNRWSICIKAISEFSIVGYGYSLTVGGGGNIHNIPLIIMNQLGPVASIAWVGVTIYCLIKTRWKYAWVAIIAMSVFDHYLWTQCGPLWWALAGVSTASTIKSDLIFRRLKGGSQ